MLFNLADIFSHLRRKKTNHWTSENLESVSNYIVTPFPRIFKPFSPENESSGARAASEDLLFSAGTAADCYSARGGFSKFCQQIRGQK